jgi:tRNA-dihydrouridine synthase A
MAEAVSIPVTAKTRIGIDEDDSYTFFSDFVGMLVDAGIQKLVVHARKAWLHGLNPKQNRTIPPLHPDYAWRIRAEIAPIPVVINGNITTVDTTREHLQHVDGVMVGRLVCQHPWGLASLHQALFPEGEMPTRAQVLDDYIQYLLESPIAAGVPRGVLLKPIMNLAHGLPDAKRWKEAIMHLRTGDFAAGLRHAHTVLTGIEKSGLTI